MSNHQPRPLHHRRRRMHHHHIWKISREASPQLFLHWHETSLREDDPRIFEFGSAVTCTEEINAVSFDPVILGEGWSLSHLDCFDWFLNIEVDRLERFIHFLEYSTNSVSRKSSELGPLLCINWDPSVDALAESLAVLGGRCRRNPDSFFRGCAETARHTLLEIWEKGLYFRVDALLRPRS